MNDVYDKSFSISGLNHFRTAIYSTLRKLVNKGLWDVAESIAEEDPQLVDYLVCIAFKEYAIEIVIAG